MSDFTGSRLRTSAIGGRCTLCASPPLAHIPARCRSRPVRVSRPDHAGGCIRQRARARPRGGAGSRRPRSRAQAGAPRGTRASEGERPGGPPRAPARQCRGRGRPQDRIRLPASARRGRAPRPLARRGHRRAAERQARLGGPQERRPAHRPDHRLPSRRPLRPHPRAQARWQDHSEPEGGGGQLLLAHAPRALRGHGQDAGSRYGAYYGCCILALSGHQTNPPARMDGRRPPGHPRHRQPGHHRHPGVSRMPSRLGRRPPEADERRARWARRCSSVPNEFPATLKGVPRGPTPNGRRER